MRATLFAAIGAIGILTTAPPDCTVRPPRATSGELYLVDANGDKWPVVELGEPGTQGPRNLKGKLYMPEREWLVEFEVVGPGDGPEPGRYRGEKWQAYGPVVGGVSYGLFFLTSDCTGEGFQLGTSTEPGLPACRPVQSLDEWQPVMPSNFGYQILDNGESLGAIPDINDVVSTGNFSGRWPDGELTSCSPFGPIPPEAIPPDLVVEACAVVDVTPENWPGPPPSPYTIKFDRL